MKISISKRLNFVFPCMYGPGKRFYVPIIASCKSFLEKGFSLVYVHVFLVSVQAFLLFVQLCQS